mgnify:CR=1 FL=1
MLSKNTFNIPFSISASFISTVSSSAKDLVNALLAIPLKNPPNDLPAPLAALPTLLVLPVKLVIFSVIQSNVARY